MASSQASNHHSPLHWIVVVFIKTFLLIFWTPLAICFWIIGYEISKSTLSAYLPQKWFNQIDIYHQQLLYLPILKKYTVDRIELTTGNIATWWTMVVAIPLMIIGLNIFIIAFFNFWHTLTKPQYNQTHCPFCKHTVLLTKQTEHNSIKK